MDFFNWYRVEFGFGCFYAAMCGLYLWLILSNRYPTFRYIYIALATAMALDSGRSFMDATHPHTFLAEIMGTLGAACFTVAGFLSIQKAIKNRKVDSAS